MRLLKIAILLALALPSLAFAQMTNSPSATGRFGPIISGTDLNGNAGRFILQGVTLVDPVTGLPYSATTSGALAARVQGNSAAGVADVGDPVKVGAKYNLTLPTYTDGQRTDLQASMKGSLSIVINDPQANGTINAAQVNTTADDTSNATNGLASRGFGLLFDGTTWDRARTLDGAALAGASVGVAAMANVATNSARQGIVTSVTSAASTGVVFVASPGNLYHFDCKSSVTGNCIAMNRTTIPSAGALTSAEVLKCVPVAAGGMAGFQFGTIPQVHTAGIVVIFSSSADCDTYTASATAKITGAVRG